MPPKYKTKINSLLRDYLLLVILNGYICNEIIIWFFFIKKIKDFFVP